MRTPRRVPWASKAELSELYDMIFSPGANDISLQAALSRMSIYVSSPSCPSFMHLLHTLVTSLLLPYPPTSAQEASTARSAYALAIVRFVNGMVDPLQTGLHARPISHLAATLGLPPHLVSLRHRATHEDLPPLPLLRRALESALDYLHRNSLLPLLASTSAAGWDRRARAGALVARWKKVVKARVRARDVTKESASGRAVKALLREFEGEDAEDVVEAVVRTGLVPVGRKKRPGSRATAPTTESLQLWTPLLSHLSASGVPLPTMLSATILDVISETAPRHNPDADEERRRELASYRWTLGTWLFWLWEEGEFALAEEERAGVLKRLARELVHNDEVVRRVYAHIAAEPVEELDALLLSDEGGEDDEMQLEGLELGEEQQEELDVDAALAGMEANVRALETSLHQSRPVPAAALDADAEVPGWSRAEGWTPCPLGVWA